jgi:L-asparaginase
MKSIEIICTGGSIDAGIDYDNGKIAYSAHAESNIKKYLEKYIKPEFEIHETTVCMRDSNDIDDKIRAKILGAIQKSKCENIIVTHGTDTLPQTARFLDTHVGSKRVILVGAFKPLIFSPSDAAFNLGFAISAFERIESGVYVAMNARLFNANAVEKDFMAQKFVTRK